jgi:hypothetical protein
MSFMYNSTFWTRPHVIHVKFDVRDHAKPHVVHVIIFDVLDHTLCYHLMTHFLPSFPIFYLTKPHIINVIFAILDHTLCRHLMTHLLPLFILLYLTKPNTINVIFHVLDHTLCHHLMTHFFPSFPFYFSYLIASGLQTMLWKICSPLNACMVGAPRNGRSSNLVNVGVALWRIASARDCSLLLCNV